MGVFFLCFFFLGLPPARWAELQLRLPSVIVFPPFVTRGALPTGGGEDGGGTGGGGGGGGHGGGGGLRPVSLPQIRAKVVDIVETRGCLVACGKPVAGRAVPRDSTTGRGRGSRGIVKLSGEQAGDSSGPRILAEPPPRTRKGKKLITRGLDDRLDRLGQAVWISSMNRIDPLRTHYRQLLGYIQSISCRARPGLVMFSRPRARCAGTVAKRCSARPGAGSGFLREEVPGKRLRSRIHLLEDSSAAKMESRSGDRPAGPRLGITRRLRDGRFSVSKRVPASGGSLPRPPPARFLMIASLASRRSRNNKQTCRRASSCRRINRTWRCCWFRCIRIMSATASWKLGGLPGRTCRILATGLAFVMSDPEREARRIRHGITFRPCALSRRTRWASGRDRLVEHPTISVNLPTFSCAQGLPRYERARAIANAGTSESILEVLVWISSGAGGA